MAKIKTGDRKTTVTRDAVRSAVSTSLKQIKSPLAKPEAVVRSKGKAGKVKE